MRRVQIMQSFQNLGDVARDKPFVEFPKRLDGLAQRSVFNIPNRGQYAGLSQNQSKNILQNNTQRICRADHTLILDDAGV